MKHINFATDKKTSFSLKFKMPSIKNLEFNRLALLLIAGATILAMLSFGIIQKMRLDKEISAFNQLQSQQSKSVELPEQEEELTKTGLTKNKVLASYNRKTNWSSVLQQISGEIPSGIWLSSIANTKDNPMHIEISGEATGQPYIASLLENLKQKSICDQAKLVSSEKTKTNNKNSRTTFLVICELGSNNS